MVPKGAASYAIPQTIRNLDGKISFKLRVIRPLKKCAIVFSQNGQIVKRIAKPFMIPSEMEIVKLDGNLFSLEKGDIEVLVLED